MVNQFDYDAKRNAGTSGTAEDSSTKLRKRHFEVLVTEEHRSSTFNIDEFNAALNSPFGLYEGATNTVCECLQFNRAFRTTKDPSDKEAMVTDPLRTATTAAAMTDVTATVTVTSVVTSTTTTRSQRPAATSATYLHHRRQATPTGPSSDPTDRST
jgi:hypothetical protein